MFDLENVLLTGVLIAGILAQFNEALITWIGNTFPAIRGPKQFATSMVLGFLEGAPTMYFINQPTNPAGWFAVGLVGVSVGLAASGLYNSEKAAAAKGSGDALGLEPKGRG